MKGALENLEAIIRKAGLAQMRIWTCACGQKNRVDAAKVIALATQARCGKCGLVLRYENGGGKP